MLIAIPVLNQHDVTIDCVKTWIETAKGSLKFLFIDNGSSKPLSELDFIKDIERDHRVHIIRNQTNIGVYPTFQLAYDFNASLTREQFIFYSHNDVEMIEYGWDQKINNLLNRIKSQDGVNPGVCGMYGAKGIGTQDIYQSMYDFRQMIRWDCRTVQSMMMSEKERIDGDYERITVLDGFSLIVNVDAVKSFRYKKFDHASFPVHHMYDNDICLESHFAGYKNYVLNVDCKHLGGRTSTKERWAEDLSTTDESIHRESHRVFYDKWRGKLPVGVQ